MASIYENIKSAKELVTHVMAHGISTKDEDIVVAQDIIGHSTIEELDELANDIGMEDRNGNPDPKGTMYSGKRGTRNTFYFILFHVWSWEDATRFWNQHTNLEHEELERLRSEKKAAAATIEKLTHDLETAKSTLHTDANMVQTANTSLAAAEKRAADAEAEVIRLKAKLYDMMMASK